VCAESLTFPGTRGDHSDLRKAGLIFYKLLVLHKYELTHSLSAVLISFLIAVTPPSNFASWPALGLSVKNVLNCNLRFEHLPVSHPALANFQCIPAPRISPRTTVATAIPRKIQPYDNDNCDNHG